MQRKEINMDERDLQIQKLRAELKEVKSKLEYTKKFINSNCIYDEHLQGYCLDLPLGKVRTLMYKIGGIDKKE